MQKWPTTCFVFLSFNYIFKAAIWVFHKKIFNTYCVFNRF